MKRDEITNITPSDTNTATVLSMSHNEFTNMSIKSLLKPNSVAYDVKVTRLYLIDGRL